jgi:hypothetical protein
MKMPALNLVLGIVAIMTGACQAAPAPAASTIIRASTGSAPSPNESVATTQVTPTPTPAAEWRRIAATPLAGNVHAAAWFNDRWLAVGDDGGSPAKPRAWWSTDGAMWHVAKLALPKAMTGTSNLVALAVRNDLVVAVGWRDGATSGVTQVDLASWDAPGGTSPVTLALDRPRSDARLAAACGGYLLSARALVMTTTDGESWSTAPESDSLAGAAMFGIAARDGAFVAVGGDQGAGRSASWTSPDGVRWVRSPEHAALHAATMTGIAVLGTTLLAAGTRPGDGGCPDGPFLWWSTDGVAWSVATVVPSGSALAPDMRIVANSSIAVAMADPVGGHAFTSDDGQRWLSNVLPEDAWFGPIQALRNGFVLIGQQSVWFSADAVHWSKIATPGAALEVLAASPDAVLAIGQEIWLGPLPGD